MTQKLIIDWGNSRIKLAWFQGTQIQRIEVFPELNELKLKQLLQENPVEACVLSSVTSKSDQIISLLNNNGYFISLNDKTPIPLKNLYKTPERLGKDRLGAAIGANLTFLSQNVLSIDAGTCIKYDFVNAANEYLGGSISPGLMMRYKSLNAFTDKLPLLTISDSEELIGYDTESSLISGVQLGALAEVEGIIQRYTHNNPDLKVILTGGDMNFFEKRLKKNGIFADPYLVLHGLNYILDFNMRS